MTSALEASCPTLSTKLKKPASRWTKSMVNRRERLIKIKQRALHNKLIPNKHKEILKLRRQYSKGKKELSKLIRKVKKENWHDYCSKIEKLKDTARLAKVSETKNTSLGALLKEDGSFTNSPLETIQHLSDGLLGPETNSMIKQTISADISVSDIHKFINANRLRKAVKRLKKNKAPGPDGITNEMITNSIHTVSSKQIF